MSLRKLLNGTAIVASALLAGFTTTPGHADPSSDERVLVLFSADDGKRGTELWVTDGTRQGTQMVSNLLRGPVGSHPEEITLIADGLAVFRAEHARAGVELWVTDGTAEGTQLVQNISGDRGSSWPWMFAALGDGRAVFSADDGQRGAELWVTDGTREGTNIVQNIGGDQSSWPTDMTSIGNGRAVFAADHPVRGRQVWITDGTRQGTSMIKVIAPGGSHPWGFTLVGEEVLFSASDGVRGAELWATDGTSEGTRLVRNINRDAGSWPTYITDIGNGLAIFSADDGRRGAEPWVSDGTRAGTELLRNINRIDDMFGEWPGMYTPMGDGRAVFAADDGWRGTELWVTDGTSGGTRIVQDINPGPDSSHPGIYGHKIAVGLGDGRALFMADDGVHGLEPWITDGTRRGTRLLVDTWPGPDGGAGFGMGDGLISLGDGRALFTAATPEHGMELWITDGTPRGTKMVRDINRGEDGSWPDNMVLFGNLPASHPLVVALDLAAAQTNAD